MNLLIRNFGEVVNKKMRFSVWVGFSFNAFCWPHLWWIILQTAVLFFAVTVEDWLLLLAPYMV